MNFITTADFAVLDFIKTYLTCDFLDFLMPFVSFLGNAGFIWILATVFLLIRKSTRKTGLKVAGSLLLMFIFCSLISKPLVARIRPFDINTAVTLLIQKPLDFSFPSGHTASAFAFSATIFFANKKAGVLLAIFSVLMGFSRLYLYVHYPSDVLSGCLLGIVCAVLSCKIIDYIYKKRKNT